ncbi:MAG: tRNA lysidine(34) synthetase TilS [Rhodospirillales bacterium 20-64-7]|nr:MAG: tRNA lysidine(34) synthetase TilS [Rhodospirillales bacterium 20-64-7]
MDRLGPWTNPPRLAVAVSGGADSTALALLAQGWARDRGGDVTGYIVDHGLRAESRDEAATVAARLAGRGISSRILTLQGLGPPALQEKARAARYQALGAAARADGRLHLLLGHHAGDQAETVAMRAARGPHGLEGMAAWSARADIVVLRPLLSCPPETLRVWLAEQAMAWVEDTSNANTAFERVRIRRSGEGVPPVDSSARQAEEGEGAEFLARHGVLRPEGFALLDAAAAPLAALAALLRVLGGASYPPPRAATARLAAQLRPATLGGVRIVPAGRLGPGWLLAREPAAMAAPVASVPGAQWDGRFQLNAAVPGGMLGGLGAAAAKFPKFNDLPALVLRSQPCLRDAEGRLEFPVPAVFSPPAPATSLPFFS